MATKLTSFVAALAVAVTALAPSLAEARDHGGGYYRGGGYDRGSYDGRYDGRGRGDYRRHDDGDAVAAGVIGLALGAIIGSAITSSNNRYPPPPPRAYYPPPPAYYQPPPPQGYYGGSGYASRGCVVRERVWDPYYGQYVRIERPC